MEIIAVIPVIVLLVICCGVAYYTGVHSATKKYHEKITERNEKEIILIRKIETYNNSMNTLERYTLRLKEYSTNEVGEMIEQKIFVKIEEYYDYKYGDFSLSKDNCSKFYEYKEMYSTELLRIYNRQYQEISSKYKHTMEELKKYTKRV